MMCHHKFKVRALQCVYNNLTEIILFIKNIFKKFKLGEYLSITNQFLFQQKKYSFEIEKNIQNYHKLTYWYCES